VWREGNQTGPAGVQFAAVDAAGAITRGRFPVGSGLSNVDCRRRELRTDEHAGFDWTGSLHVIGYERNTGVFVLFRPPP